MIRYKKSNPHNLKKAANVSSLLLYTQNVRAVDQKDFIKLEKKRRKLFVQGRKRSGQMVQVKLVKIKTAALKYSHFF